MHVRGNPAFVVTVTLVALAGCGEERVAPGPPGRFLFVPNRYSHSVSGFSIDPSSGSLSPLATSPLALEGATADVALDPLGRYAFVTVQHHNIMGFAIDRTTGALQPLPGSPFEIGGADAYSVAVHPSGRFLYAAASSRVVGLETSVFTIEPGSGRLALVASAPIYGGLDHLAIHPSGRFLYGTTTFDGVAGFALDPTTGALSPLPGSPFRPGFTRGWVRDLLIEPRGEFLYGRSDAWEVLGYRVNPETGALTPLGYVAQSRAALAADPMGRYVYAVAESEDSISALEIQRGTGYLSRVGESAAVGPELSRSLGEEGYRDYGLWGRLRLSVDPSGRFLYLVIDHNSTEPLHGTVLGPTGRLLRFLLEPGRPRVIAVAEAPVVLGKGPGTAVISP